MKSGLFQKGLFAPCPFGWIILNLMPTCIFSGQGLQNVQKTVHTRRVHGIFYQHNLPSLLRSYIYSSNTPAPSGSDWAEGVGGSLVVNISNC